MHQDDPYRPKVERADDNFPNADTCFIDAAVVHVVVADQHISSIEVQDAKSLVGSECEIKMQVGDQCGPIGQDRLCRCLVTQRVRHDGSDLSKHGYRTIVAVACALLTIHRARQDLW